jgi:peptidoglycan/LPS O-acetylase OafA/YrhL
MFSHVLWPILVPLAVLLIEPDAARRRILQVLLVGGLAVGLYLLYFVSEEGIEAQVVGSSIEYASPHLYLPLVLVVYVAATCVSSLVSSHSLIRLLGVLMFAALLLTGLASRETFISVWCFFAAALSVVVYMFVRSGPAAGGRQRSVESYGADTTRDDAPTGSRCGTTNAIERRWL